MSFSEFKNKQRTNGNLSHISASTSSKPITTIAKKGRGGGRGGWADLVREKNNRDDNNVSNDSMPPKFERVFSMISNDMTTLAQDIIRIKQLAQQGLREGSLPDPRHKLLLQLIPECEIMLNDKQEQLHQIEKTLEKDKKHAQDRSKKLFQLRTVSDALQTQRKSFVSARKDAKRYLQYVEEQKKERLIREKRETLYTPHADVNDNFSDSGSDIDPLNPFASDHHAGAQPSLLPQRQQIQVKQNAEFQKLDRADLLRSEVERRAGHIKQIEQDIDDVHELFKDTRDLVEQQQEGLDEIEENILTAKKQVEAAMEDVEKAERLQKRSDCSLM